MRDEATLPSPLALAEQMRQLAEYWRELEPYTTQKPSDQQAERVSKSEGTEHPAPGNWSAVAVRADIHHAAHTWAKMLADDRPVKPAGEDADDLLKFAATYPGYYTNHDDPAIAYAVADELSSLLTRAQAIIDPSDINRTPIGQCFGDDCTEKLYVRWTQGEGKDDERAWRLRSTPLVAKCKRGHVIDAMIYAAGVNA